MLHIYGGFDFFFFFFCSANENYDIYEERLISDNLETHVSDFILNVAGYV